MNVLRMKESIVNAKRNTKGTNSPTFQWLISLMFLQRQTTIEFHKGLRKFGCISRSIEILTFVTLL